MQPDRRHARRGPRPAPHATRPGGGARRPADARQRAAGRREGLERAHSLAQGRHRDHRRGGDPTAARWTVPRPGTRRLAAADARTAPPSAVARGRGESRGDGDHRPCQPDRVRQPEFQQDHWLVAGGGGRQHPGDPQVRTDAAGDLSRALGGDPGGQGMARRARQPAQERRVLSLAAERSSDSRRRRGGRVLPRRRRGRHREPSGRAGARGDPHGALPGAENGGPGAPRGRRGARLQQSSRDHPRLLGPSRADSGRGLGGARAARRDPQGHGASGGSHAAAPRLQPAPGAGGPRGRRCGAARGLAQDARASPAREHRAPARRRARSSGRCAPIRHSSSRC